MDQESERLFRAAVTALPSTFHQLLVEQGDEKGEARLLSVLRLLVCLSSFDPDDLALREATRKAYDGCPKNSAGGFSAVSSISVRVISKEESRVAMVSFSGNDSVILARSAYELAVGKELTKDTLFTQALNKYERVERTGGPSQRDEEREAELDALLEKGSHWGCWIEWRKRLLQGTSVSEVLAAASQLTDEDWSARPQTVGHKMRKLAHAVLKTRIQRLETGFDRLGMGGNNPPEPIEGELEPELPLLREPLNDLKAQVDSDAPDRSLVRRAIDRLGKRLLQLGDMTAEELAKGLGKWAGPALLVELTGVLDAAKLWWSTLF